MKIEIANGRLIDPANGVDRATSLYIAAGRVVAIGEPPAGWHANRFDLCARLREPGLEYKATLESEMEAATAGGVTSLACPPDTDPPLDEPGLVEMLKHRARSLNQAHVYPIGALSVQLQGTTLTEMSELAEAGCVAFSHADVPLVDTQLLWRAMEYASTFGHQLWLRAADPHLGRGGVAHDGEVATRLGLSGIPAASETIALATILSLMRETGVRLHVTRLSAAGSVALIRAAKQDGLPVTCDVAVHHLHLCDVDIGWFDANANFVPPLRTTRDRAALRAGVTDGTIDSICSDHAPVDDNAKLVPFAEAEPGAIGLELLLPLTLKWATEDGVPLPVALARITSEPGKLLPAGAGQLAVGAVADVCVFDPQRYWRVEESALKSQGKNTPFLGLEVAGKVRWTLVGGQVVHEG